MKKYLIFLLLFSFQGKAQLPNTQIYLFDVQRTSKGYSLSHPQLVSKETGYNNQPFFSLDGKYLYYSSSVTPTNTEIYAINLHKKRLRSKRLTRSKEPEYSPKLTFEEDRISSVVVEKDTVTQHLYTFNLRGGKPKVIKPELKSIGYYEWLSPFEFVSFELPEPFYFVKHNLIKNTDDTIAQNIGRTFFYSRSKGKILYVDKNDSLHWKIRMISPILKRNTPKDDNVVTETLPQEEDFCVLMDGSVLMGHQGILYIKKNPFKNKNAPWETLMDLNKFGIKRFQRLAVTYTNSKLAVVALP